MADTVHIFDEFLGPEESMTPQRRHEKRMNLEPFIFDILKRKYGEAFRSFWKSHTIPTNPDRAVVLIERRIHPNVEFILHNMTYYAPTWSIVVLCSDVNYRYLKTITQGKNVVLFRMFEGSPSREEARIEYNSLLQSAEFYESMPWETMIFMQTDSYLMRAIPDEMLEYDFIASPASWDTASMVGGISLRKRSAMIRICQEFKAEIPGEDVYITEGAKAIGLKIPPYDTAVKYFTESVIYDKPIGTHQWWTYFYIDPRQTLEENNYVFNCLLTCDILQNIVISQTGVNYII